MQNKASAENEAHQRIEFKNKRRFVVPSINIEQTAVSDGFSDVVKDPVVGVVGVEPDGKPHNNKD